MIRIRMTRRPRAGTLPLRLVSALGIAAGIAASPAFVPADDERPRPAVEAHEWSVWVASPSQDTFNASRVYRNAMPGPVGTIRPKAEGKELDRKFPIAPVSVVQFFGEPTKDLDIDVRVKAGSILAHWPPGNDRGGRVQWFKSDLAKTPPAGVPSGFIPDGHWFQKLRKVEGALHHVRESRAERFLAYDAELTARMPVKIRGGPDEYTLQNLTPYRLLDVAVVAPTDDGFRVGWLDELPAASTETPDQVKKDKEKEDAARKKTTAAQKAEGVFGDAEKAKEKKDEVKPLPPEGDADIKARVDQILNRPVTVNVQQASRKDVLDLISGQARLRYELDGPTIAQEKIDLGSTMTMTAGNVAARDVLADVLGTVGLSYRVTDDGSLFITTAARLAEDANKKGAVVEGPPIKLTLSLAFKPDNPSYRELTRDSYVRRLAGQGLREEAVNTLLDQYADALFRPDGLIVIAHYAREAIDEAVPLDVFPEPKKMVRVAVVVEHGVDPRLQDRARALVQKLGEPSPKARETAETQLYDLGPVAVPVLEDALREKDLEVVFRAERILLKLNRKVP